MFGYLQDSNNTIMDLYQHKVSFLNNRNTTNKARHCEHREAMRGNLDRYILK